MTVPSKKWVRWSPVIALEWILIGAAVLAGSQGSNDTFGEVWGYFFLFTGLAMLMVWLLIIRVPAKSEPPPVSRDVLWDLHGGQECETCDLFHKDDPHPLDWELRHHVPGCKCQRCLRRRADQLKAKVLDEHGRPRIHS